MLWHYSCKEELCPHFVRKNGFVVPKTIGITALFRFCGSFPLYLQTWFSHAKPRFFIVFHSDYPLISAIPQRPRLFCSQFVATSDSPQNHMTQLQMNDAKEIAKWKN